MDPAAIRERADSLPREPGVYQFLADDRVLYIGKAVDLRDRVRTYADPRSERVRTMVRRAEDVDVAVTDTETQALLLEANLVKRHQPRYNVRLKDDKSYPLVEFTDHPVPRIEVTRDPEPGSTVYGPFTDKGDLESVVKALRDVFGLRGCSDHKYRNRDRPCLDYDVGLCDAPCTGEIGEEAYREGVEAAKRFFEGETGVLADPLRSAMEEAAKAKEFERAANHRDRLETVEALHGSGGAAVTDDGDERTIDVLGVAVEGDSATVSRLHSEGGKLVDRDRHRVSAPGGTDRIPAILSAFVPQFFAERELPDALLLPQDPGDSELADWLEAEGVSMRVPGAGREATLVDLATKNAHRGPQERDPSHALKDALGIDLPTRIEGFDVSHASGRDVVGSNVLFVDGTPKTAGYRRKKLQETNDDYENMRALLEWRARRAVEGRDDRPDPDLLLIDGGEGQLEAARVGIAAVNWDVPVLALAKAEEVVITPDGRFDWPEDASHLHLLQRVRDEAHRFAVQYHQTLRDDVSTVLESIDGIGPTRRKRLLRRFGSVDGVRAASADELATVPGIGRETAEHLRSRL
ncbi:MAG: excinuclease ABC subunit C [Halodesulfurarchaeum sp.]